MEIILASQSPRRQELMGFFPFPFTVRVSQADEKMDSSRLPQDEVARISRNKAYAVERTDTDIVIGADTIVVCDGEVLGKPKDEQDAFRMLVMLSGRSHQVMTGVTVLQGERSVSFTEITDVYFRKLKETEIYNYIHTGDPMDKAGAYGIQSDACIFVEKLVGDYYNVVGLPVCRLYTVLQRFMEETQ
ncbi:MAG: septum formation inhibitor Maf [Oscillospiraceae bacterium]|nr:septum formation inhibitor Maf [Oscillospiraceae bacterium]